ncbi:MAG: TRAP transporter small permease [Tepidanaerobacter acetatoxydans]|uniref:TRAP transporter small permease n=1 Tax=Tepidanaerobacter acetatoxydans TaxID=499229 RepID=UPI0026ECF469|nr:TRAP transporter small permease [Tepidanaerobacter acetatoxydans]NLU10067.1 TRAP transporter small permease [Tepidanaerobacter acetatoxydans]
MDILKNLDEYISGISLVILIVTVSTNVFCRYLLGIVFNWAEELSTICFIWCVYCGTAAVYKNNQHIGIDVCVNLLPESLRKIVALFVDVFVLILNLTITYLSIVMMKSSINKLTPVMQISYALVNSSVTLGFGLMSIYSIGHIIKKLKK